YDPVKMALLGMLMAGAALFGLSQIQELWQLYALFLFMGSGFTLASPATMTKLISSVFTKRRGLALSLAGSGSAVGETMLVPTAAVIVTLSGWRPAYFVLAIILVVVIIPISYRLLKTKAEAEVDDRDPAEMVAAKTDSKGSACMWMPDDGMSLKQAVKTPIFWALTFGFFT
ncbi:MAG: MFS transporter, partial [Chloroflexi bacterium]|nr:MFS transporter [Chloroflexota bacterium]